MVIPDSDFSASVLDRNQDRLEQYFLFPHIGHRKGAIVEWMNKSRQKEAAQSVGLNVARGWTIEIVDGVYNLPSDIRYPCFLKPLATISGGKRNLGRIDDEENLRTILDRFALAGNSISLMLEQFMNIEIEHALLGFTDGREVVIPGVIRMLSMAGGLHFGVAKKGEILPPIGFEDRFYSVRFNM